MQYYKDFPALAKLEGTFSSTQMWRPYQTKSEVSSHTYNDADS